MSEQTPLVERLVNANQLMGVRAAITPSSPAMGLTVVTCMDARVLPPEALGLRSGDAHMLRNAGGRVSDDVLRSLAVSCSVYDVRDVAIVHHTDCGMVKSEAVVRDAIARASGGHQGPDDLGMIGETDAELAADVDRVRACPFLPGDLRVWGLRFDVKTGLISLEIEAG